MYSTCRTTSTKVCCRNVGWTNLVAESDEVIVDQDGETSQTDHLQERGQLREGRMGQWIERKRTHNR